MTECFNSQNMFIPSRGVRVRPTYPTGDVAGNAALVHHIERGRTSGKPRPCDAIAWCQIALKKPCQIAANLTAYLEALSLDLATPSVKQHLATLRMLFDS